MVEDLLTGFCVQPLRDRDYSERANAVFRADEQLFAELLSAHFIMSRRLLRLEIEAADRTAVRSGEFSAAVE